MMLVMAWTTMGTACMRLCWICILEGYISGRVEPRSSRTCLLGWAQNVCGLYFFADDCQEIQDVVHGASALRERAGCGHNPIWPSSGVARNQSQRKRSNLWRLL